MLLSRSSKPLYQVQWHLHDVWHSWRKITTCVCQNALENSSLLAHRIHFTETSNLPFYQFIATNFIHWYLIGSYRWRCNIVEHTQTCIWRVTGDVSLRCSTDLMDANCLTKGLVKVKFDANCFRFQGWWCQITWTHHWATNAHSHIACHMFKSHCLSNSKLWRGESEQTCVMTQLSNSRFNVLKESRK